MLAINCDIQHFMGHSFFADMFNYIVTPAMSAFAFFALSIMVKELDDINKKIHSKE